MPIILPRWNYSTREQRGSFFREILNGTARGSGVASTAVTSLVPPDGWGGDAVVVDGRPEPTPGVAVRDVLQVSVSSSYFKVMGVPLQMGQAFDDDRDNENNPAVALVNEAFVRKYFPSQNAIGSRIKVLSAPGSAPPWLTVMGVVGNEKHQNFFGPMGWQEIPIVYRPITQEPPFRVFFLIHAPIDTATVLANFRKQVESLDDDVAIGDLQMMDERLSRTLAYPRFRAIVLTAFAALALLLAAIGLYAVLSQLIGQRMQEFGIRMALGAQKRDLLKLVLREGLVLTLAGLAAGFAIALSVAELLNSLVYGLKTTDPWTLAAGSLLLVFVTFSAMYVPAVRASRVDPKVAIRYE
jgi:putative ABC transport system permease protein